MAEHELKKRSIGRDGAVQTFVRRSLPIEQRLVQTQQSFRKMKQLGGGMAASGHGSIRRRLFDGLLKVRPAF